MKPITDPNYLFSISSQNPQCKYYLPDPIWRAYYLAKQQCILIYNRDIWELVPIQLINELLYSKIIRISKYFNEGDIICAKRNADNKLIIFFQATSKDVEYSGSKEYYIVNQ